MAFVIRKTSFFIMNTLSLFAGSLVIPCLMGSLAALLFGNKSPQKKIPGLLFHSVLPCPGLNLSEYPLDNFHSFLQALNNHNIKTISVKDTLNVKSDLDKGSRCILSFDDGLECFYKYTLPVLQQTRHVSTVFCVAGYLGRFSGWDVYPTKKHLNKEQIRIISDNGHEIGSHTLTHANLPYLRDKDLDTELKRSKEILEDITSKPVTSISFPHGSWNQRVWEKAKAAGYTAATLYRGHNNAQSDQFPVFGAFRFDSTTTLLKRISPNNRIFSSSIAAAKLLSHFSKGTPVWKFRKTYRFFLKG